MIHSLNNQKYNSVQKDFKILTILFLFSGSNLFYFIWFLVLRLEICSHLVIENYTNCNNLEAHYEQKYSEEKKRTAPDILSHYFKNQHVEENNTSCK